MVQVFRFLLFVKTADKEMEKQMFDIFFPDEYVDSAYEIDYEMLYKKGIRAVIYDIDNTLVPHGAKADERSVKHFDKMRQIGYRCMLLSNNKEPRVKMFYDDVHVPYIYDAGKPAAKNYIRAMEEMGVTREETIFVGDQLFTDILGAKRCGIKTYLVKPIHPKEEIQIVFKRKLEKIVLYFYDKKRKKEEKI